MSTYGITDQGFVLKRLEDIKAEIEEDLKSVFGNEINLNPESVFGQMVGIFSERESLIWEKMESVYNSQYPDSSTGSSLDKVASLNSLTRLEATKSAIVGQALFGTTGTIIPASSTFSVENNSTAVFETVDAVTLIAGTNEVQTLTFSATPTSGAFQLQYTGIVYGQETTVSINWDDVAADVQTALNNLDGLSGVTVTGSYAAGFVVTFAGDDGKQPQNALVATNNTLDAGGAVSITITETTAGVYQGTVNMNATATGPTVANAGTLNVIDNPVTGLDRTFNPEDAVQGRDIEKDPAFRLRREERVTTSEAGTVEAIRNALLDLNEIEDEPELEAVTIFENIGLTTDSRGLPGKSFESFVYQAGGVTTRDQEIADTIWESKPAGIEPHGDVSKTVTDSQGLDHTIKFSRPTEVDIYLILDLTTNSLYPTDGDIQVEEAMTTWGNALGVGVSVIVYGSNALVNQLDDIPGITDISVKIGIAPAPTLDDNIPIDDGTGGTVELSRWDTANITVNS